MAPTNSDDESDVHEERRLELLSMVAEFINGPLTQTSFSPSLAPAERLVLQEEAIRCGLVPQSAGQKRGRFLRLRKRTSDETSPASGESRSRTASFCMQEAVRNEVVELNVAGDTSDMAEGKRSTASMHEATEALPQMHDAILADQASENPSSLVPDCGRSRIGSSWQDDAAPTTELAITGAFQWLSLQTITCAARVCQCWASFATHVPVQLPPPQVDLVLQFCLLEVLADFDDDRLPLPMSAVFGEMCVAARKATACQQRRLQLERQVLRVAGPAYKTQQLEFFKNLRVHHVPWQKACADLRRSGFKTLEKLGKYFHSEKLIDVFHQRWRKQIHHSPNTRTCKEWLLTRVNREHPLFVEHMLWRLTALPESTAA